MKNNGIIGSTLYEKIKNSPYYSEMNIEKDYFERIKVDRPLLKKSEIQQYAHKILNRNYKNLDLESLHVARTSGSTGEPLEVFWDHDELMRSNLGVWRLRKKLHGIDASSRYIAFHSIIYNKSKPLNTEKIMTFGRGICLSFSKFNLNDEDLDIYFSEMDKFEPKWMLIQPSIAFRLMEYLKAHNRKLSSTIGYIELNGEMISKEDEDKLKKAFGLPIANMYGCNEVNTIAYECPYGNMHVLISNVLLQLYDTKEDSTGVSGSVVVSSLQNSVFPVLGYDLGDRVHILKDSVCPCGNCSPIIDRIYGRKGEEIVLPSGEKLNPFLFTYCVEILNSRFGNPIKQFKVLYDDVRIKLLLRIDDTFKNWKTSISEELTAICLKKFEKPVPLDIEYTDMRLELGKNGKYELIEKG